jgi:GNAT superfamily N-acetyltransferase
MQRCIHSMNQAPLQVQIGAGMRVVIRVAESSDAVAACQVLCRAISECCAEDHRNDAEILTAWLGNKTPENVASWFDCAANFSVVAHTDDQLVGVAIMTRQGKIVLFYVAPEMRFTGTGKALLQALEAQAAKWALRTLQVASTLTAQAFYTRNGFAEIGSTRSAFGTNAVSLSKNLCTSSYPKRPPCGCGG